MHREKITLIDGCEAVINKVDINFENAENLCVTFEELQIIAGDSEQEQSFFEVYNAAFERSIPILITLNSNSQHLQFEARIFSRLSWGMKAEIV